MGFQIGDLVWAKMKGYPPWPAQIVERKSNVKEPKNKKNHQFVLFFGTNDFAWMPEESIMPHSNDVFDNLNKKKTKAYQQAINKFLDFQGTKKGEKQTSPKIKEERKKSKVVKVDQSVSKKCERNVLSSKTLVKKVSKKRRKEDNQTSPPSKFRKLDTLDHSSKSTIERDQSFEGQVSLLSSRPTSNINYEDSNSDGAEKFGFIGLDDFSTAILLRLVEHGIDISLWKADIEQYSELAVLDKVKVVDSPAQLVVDCDVVFCCCDTDSDAFKDIIFGREGILDGFETAKKLELRRKGYVGLYSIDHEISNKINEAITVKNGYYLEAPIIGTIEEAKSGQLILLASGHTKLFTLCENCFKIIAEESFFLNCEIGVSSIMSVLLNVLSGNLYASLFETMILAKRIHLCMDDFRQVFEKVRCSDIFDERIQKMSDQDFGTVVTPLKHVQKDLNLGLSLANGASQPMPVTSTANEVFKKARRLNYSDFDVSLIYKVLGAPPKKDKGPSLVQQKL